MNVIEASGLGKRYGSTQALRDCTLAIPAGRVTALVGPNGAGKSTFLNLAVGLSAPSEGSLTVLGGGRLPAVAPAGHPFTLVLSTMLPIGSGTLRYTPVGPHYLAAWDFDVETD